MNKTLYAFDLDDTLVTSDFDKEIETFLMSIEYIKPISEMDKLFKSLRDKMILTSRHPNLAEEISAIYGCPVECRNFCLSVEEMKSVNTTHESIEMFLDHIIKWKTIQLNELATCGKWDRVVLYDDLAERFDPTRLENNIQLRLPLHMKYTDDRHTCKLDNSWEIGHDKCNIFCEHLDRCVLRIKWAKEYWKTQEIHKCMDCGILFDTAEDMKLHKNMFPLHSVSTGFSNRTPAHYEFLSNNHHRKMNTE